MRYCPQGHSFDDNELTYCPKCGLPLHDSPIDQQYNITNQFEADYMANNESQQTSQNNQMPLDSPNDSNRSTHKRKNYKGWFVGAVLGLLLIFFILELTNATCILPFLHSPRITNARLSPVMDILIVDHSEQIQYMAKEGENWTEANAPQTIDDLPYFPKQILSLYDALDKVHFSFEREGLTYTIHTNVGNLLSNQGELTIIKEGGGGYLAKPIDSNLFSVTCEDELPVVGFDWSFEYLDTRKNIRENIYISFYIENGKLTHSSVSIVLLFDPHLDQKYGFIWTGEPEVHYQIDNDILDDSQNRTDKRILITVLSGDYDYSVFFTKDGLRYYFYKAERDIK